MIAISLWTVDKKFDASAAMYFYLLFESALHVLVSIIKKVNNFL